MRSDRRQMRPSKPRIPSYSADESVECDDILEVNNLFVLTASRPDLLAADYEVEQLSEPHTVRSPEPEPAAEMPEPVAASPEPMPAAPIYWDDEAAMQAWADKALAKALTLYATPEWQAAEAIREERRKFNKERDRVRAEKKRLRRERHEAYLAAKAANKAVVPESEEQAA